MNTIVALWMLWHFGEDKYLLKRKWHKEYLVHFLFIQIGSQLYCVYLGPQHSKISDMY